jgi:outer membrane immunogenic protein
VYVGALVGASCIDGDLTDNGAVAPAIGYWENSGCGWKGGALIGYNHQVDDIVFGVEADWARSNYIATNETAGADFQFGFDHEVTFRGRVGWAMDDTLFFVTGGGAWAKGDLDGIIAADPDHIKANHWGWTIGAGVEHAFTDQFRVKLDYLYTQWKGANYTDVCPCDVDIHDFDNHEVRLGLIWAF